MAADPKGTDPAAGASAATAADVAAAAPLLPSLKAAVNEAIKDSAPALKETAKNAIKEAAKEQDADKKAKDKKEKKETGVKPRDFILPAMVVTFMAVPILAIFLPVYITAGKAYEKGANQLNYMCALTELPTPVSKAWNNIAKADNSLKNATVFTARLAARTSGRVAYAYDASVLAPKAGARAEAALEEYFEFQQCACDQISSLVFNDDASWDCHTGPDPASKDASRSGSSHYTDLLAMFLSTQGDNIAPPPAPFPPPRPPGYLQSPVDPDNLFDYGEESEGDYSDLLAYLYDYSDDEEEEPPPGQSPAHEPPAPSPPHASPTASPSSTASPSPAASPIRSPSPSAGRKLASTGEPAPGARRKLASKPNTFASLSYNMSGSKVVPSQEQYIAGYMALKMATTKVDAQVGTVSFSIQGTPYSMYPYPLGFMDKKKINFDASKGVSTTTTVISAATNGVLKHTSGDSAKSFNVDIATVTTKSLYYYPFDTYTASVEISVATNDGNASSTVLGPMCWRTALLIRQRNLAVGWDIAVDAPVDPTNAVVNRINQDGDGSGYVSYTISLSRTSFVKFFAIITLIFMWILGTFTVFYALDALFLRRRTLVVGDAIMFFTAIFAYGNMRLLMPDVPKIGVGIDFFGYIWIVLMLMGTCAMVYARVVAQNVHNEPTLYDQVFNRPYYLEWSKEQAEKKKKEEQEEAKKKEEDKRKKEEEERKKEEAERTKEAEIAERKEKELHQILQVRVESAGPSAPPSPRGVTVWPMAEPSGVNKV